MDYSSWFYCNYIHLIYLTTYSYMIKSSLTNLTALTTFMPLLCPPQANHDVEAMLSLLRKEEG